jgi:hypothetical protein
LVPPPKFPHHCVYVPTQLFGEPKNTHGVSRNSLNDRFEQNFLARMGQELLLLAINALPDPLLDTIKC